MNAAAGIPVTIPLDLWDPQQEGIVSAWLFGHGDVVREGDLIAEVLVEKSTFEITAPAAGQLLILLQAETPFKPGAVIGQIR